MSNQNTSEAEICEECVLPATHKDDSVQNMNDITSIQCVTCPFCKQTVTAIITPEQIECPECKAVVKK